MRIKALGEFLRNGNETSLQYQGRFGKQTIVRVPLDENTDLLYSGSSAKSLGDSSLGRAMTGPKLVWIPEELHCTQFYSKVTGKVYGNSIMQEDLGGLYGGTITSIYNDADGILTAKIEACFDEMPELLKKAEETTYVRNWKMNNPLGRDRVVLEAYIRGEVISGVSPARAAFFGLNLFGWGIVEAAAFVNRGECFIDECVERLKADKNIMARLAGDEVVRRIREEQLAIMRSAQTMHEETTKTIEALAHAVKGQKTVRVMLQAVNPSTGEAFSASCRIKTDSLRFSSRSIPLGDIVGGLDGASQYEATREVYFFLASVNALSLEKELISQVISRRNVIYQREEALAAQTSG